MGEEWEETERTREYYCFICLISAAASPPSSSSTHKERNEKKERELVSPYLKANFLLLLLLLRSQSPYFTLCAITISSRSVFI
jgi:hypothetical protein